MSLLWVDGFENYGTSTGLPPSPTNVMSRKYSVAFESFIDIETGRDGVGYACEVSASSTLITRGLTTDRTLIIGAAVKITTSASTGNIFKLLNLANLTNGITLYFNNGDLSIVNGFTTLATTSGLGLSSGVWYWIELKIYCDNTSGTYEVRVGGVNELSGTGDTQYNNTYNYYDRVQIGTGTALFTYDDLYICDTTGAVNIDFLGNCKVETLRPNGDSAVTWAPDTGPTNYTQIDEQITDDDTTYVEASSGQDLYNYGDTINTSFKGLMVSTFVRQSDATDYTLNTVLKSGPTTTSIQHSVGASGFVGKTAVFEEDPDAAASWTQSTVNAALFGVKVG